MVSTSNPLASQAAIGVLKDGGNAIDAAVAAMAVLSVVETLNVGIGGDCFALYAPGGAGKIVAYNGSGRAPAAAAGGWYRERGHIEVPKFGPHSVTVPGALDAWSRLVQDHGTRALGDLLAPAISYAESGYPVHDVIATLWCRSIERLKTNPEATRLLLWNGRGPAPGDIHRQPDLAATLRTIARDGIDAFYRGAIGDAICRHLAALGGLHTMSDFAAHRGDYVEAISLGYQGHVVHECPPNGQGIAALLMLGMLRGFPLGELDPCGADRLHIAIESGKRAIHARDRLVGDPSTAGAWEALLTESSLNAEREQLDPARAMPERTDMRPPAMGTDTCHVAVVDRDRNCVSLIASVFEDFGSGVVVPGTGVLLQNRGHGFVLAEGHPNEIGAGKRPLHTIIPALVTESGRVAYALGVVGGHYQAWGQTHVITNLLDYGMDAQEALDAPRAYHNGRNVEIERGFSDDVVSGLERRGHSVLSHARVKDAWPLGGGQLVAIDWRNGAFVGAADPRMDGCALGY
jgi:gamma-glutamyltranspeptidase/glutathione hydrolase